MLHELLFALNGHHGHIFMLHGGRFKVNDALPFFHPAEVGILNQLLDIATDFWKVECFIHEHRNVTMEYTEKGKLIILISKLLNCSKCYSYIGGI